MLKYFNFFFFIDIQSYLGAPMQGLEVETKLGVLNNVYEKLLERNNAADVLRTAREQMKHIKNRVKVL